MLTMNLKQILKSQQDALDDQKHHKQSVYVWLRAHIDFPFLIWLSNVELKTAYCLVNEDYRHKELALDLCSCLVLHHFYHLTW